MENINQEIGNRLREIRDIFHEGVKLSADQFAFILDETGDKIRNYELGRAAISVRLLRKLYEKGINPTYVITGEGDIFADNTAGDKRRETIKQNYEKGKLESKNKIILAAAGMLDG
jgi:hypothetical protein